jgi:hypothetical protein
MLWTCKYVHVCAQKPKGILIQITKANFISKLKCPYAHEKMHTQTILYSQIIIDQLNIDDTRNPFLEKVTFLRSHRRPL